MSLKDWKKVSKDYWEKKSKTNVFRGEPGTDKLGIIKVYSEETEEYTDYGVTIMISGGGITTKQFESKSQALAYARSYMRKH